MSPNEKFRFGIYAWISAAALTLASMSLLGPWLSLIPLVAFGSAMLGGVAFMAYAEETKK